MAVSPGFRPDHVLTAQISVPWNKYPSWSARLAFNERLLKEIARQPGVSAAGIVNNVPLSGNSGKSAATVKGHVRLPGESPRGHYSYGVDGDYFAAMGFSLREGRFLTADDSRRSSRGSAWSTRISRDITGLTPALSANNFSRAPSWQAMRKPSPSSAWSVP